METGRTGSPVPGASQAASSEIPGTGNAGSSDVSHTDRSSASQLLDLAAQRRREKQVVDVEEEKSLIVVFDLGDGSSLSRRTDDALPARPEIGFYGLPASSVESIVSVGDITYIPGTPHWILGVVNVHGEIESVLDLRQVLDLAPAEFTSESRLLIASEGELRSGLLVDRVIDIYEATTAAISAPPAPLEGGKGVYVAGETEYGDGELVILNLSEVFKRALETDQA